MGCNKTIDISELLDNKANEQLTRETPEEINETFNSGEEVRLLSL